MKRILLALAVLGVGYSASAEPDAATVPLVGFKTNVTLTYTTTALYGYLESLEIIPVSNTGTYTNTVVVETVTNYANQAKTILFSNTTIAAGGLYRPRFDVHNSAGTVVSGTTNALERYMFCGDKVKVTGYTSYIATNTLQLVLKLWR